MTMHFEYGKKTSPQDQTPQKIGRLLEKYTFLQIMFSSSKSDKGNSSYNKKHSRSVQRSQIGPNSKNRHKCRKFFFRHVETVHQFWSKSER